MTFTPEVAEVESNKTKPQKTTKRIITFIEDGWTRDLDATSAQVSALKREPTQS